MAQLGVFAKPPQPGRVKTRLIPDIGADRATVIYRHCLQHALDVARQSKLEHSIYLTEASDDPVFGDHPRKLQSDSDLGERMHHAIADLLAQDSRGAIIIGSDCLDISAAHIVEAAESLEHNDLVLLPAYDGGYAMIASRIADSRLFRNVAWSTSQVLEKTLENASALGWRTCLLETVRDIDTLQDIEHYPELVELISQN